MPRALLGQMLKQEGLVTDAQIRSALAYQQRWRCRIGEALVDLRAVDEDRVLDVASRQLGIPAVHGLADMAIAPSVLRRLPHELILRHRILPIAAVSVPGERLIVAFARPDDLAVVSEVEFAAGTRVQPVLATASALERAIRRHYAFLRPDALELPPEPSGPMHLVDGRMIR